MARIERCRTGILARCRTDPAKFDAGNFATEPRAILRSLLPKLVAAVSIALATSAHGRGVSPYLPLDLAPEMENEIERALIIAGKPVLKRPIAAGALLDVLPSICEADEALCRSVRRYLDRYMHKIGVAHASAEGAYDSGAIVPIANAHGMASDSAWRVSARAYWQPSDYVLLNVGGVAYEGEALPTDSLLSIGFEYAQLDIGYRDHWYSPFADSSMIVSTNARTLPSVTLSNYKPISQFGISYEIFLAEMGERDLIAFQDGYTSGKPRLAGMHVSFEPASGWSLGASRMLQFGGGARGGRSFSDFIDVLFKPRENDNRSEALGQDEEFGNQVAAWSSRFIFPGRTPFAAYLEYAGEDTSYAGDYRFGNAALSIGISFPQLWQRFDLMYETSEWQNGWYVHSIYQDGLAEEGRVLGHWGADHRLPADGVGAQSHLLRLGWRPPFGGLMQFQARTVANESYSAIDYERGYDVSVAYSRAFSGFTASAELMSGQDVFGASFTRLAGSIRLGDEWTLAGSSVSSYRPRSLQDAHLFIEGGAAISRLQIRLGDGSPKQTTSFEMSPHVAIGARRAVSTRSDLGVRLEIDRIEDEMFLAVRALDYRYRFRNPLAVNVFVGAARYDLATPAYGYYMGAGLQWRDLLPRVDVGVDFRYADKVARDKLLPQDPVSDPRPDVFYDMTGATLSLSYRF